MRTALQSICMICGAFMIALATVALHDQMSEVHPVRADFVAIIMGGVILAWVILCGIAIDRSRRSR